MNHNLIGANKDVFSPDPNTGSTNPKLHFKFVYTPIFQNEMSKFHKYHVPWRPLLVVCVMRRHHMKTSIQIGPYQIS